MLTLLRLENLTFLFIVGAFESEDQATEFVRCKIESMQANKEDVSVEDEETKSFKSASRKFMKLFNMPKEEKLVNRKFVHIHNTYWFFRIYRTSNTS